MKKAILFLLMLTLVNTLAACSSTERVRPDTGSGREALEEIYSESKPKSNIR